MSFNKHLGNIINFINEKPFDHSWNGHIGN